MLILYPTTLLDFDSNNTYVDFFTASHVDIISYLTEVALIPLFSVLATFNSSYLSALARTPSLC